MSHIHCECFRKCEGLGRLPSVRAESYKILRTLKTELKKKKLVKKSLFFEINKAVFAFISSIEFNSILELEREFGCTITLVSNDEIDRHAFKIREK